MLWGEVVCLDPLEWLREGLITNPGVFVLGQPGVGKSTIVKRLITGMAACGTHALILGDTNPTTRRWCATSADRSSASVAAWTGSTPWTRDHSAPRWRAPWPVSRPPSRTS
jgi:hypothetical protein